MSDMQVRVSESLTGRGGARMKEKKEDKMSDLNFDKNEILRSEEDYKLISRCTVDELNMDVSSSTKNGFELYGVPFTAIIYGQVNGGGRQQMDTVFCQCVIKK